MLGARSSAFHFHKNLKDSFCITWKDQCENVNFLVQGVRNGPNITLLVPCITESSIEIKIKLKFYFHTSFWCLKRFYEGLKTFIKPFEAPQRSVKIKI